MKTIAAPIILTTEINTDDDLMSVLLDLLQKQLEIDKKLKALLTTTELTNNE